MKTPRTAVAALAGATTLAGVAALVAGCSLGAAARGSGSTGAARFVGASTPASRTSPPATRTPSAPPPSSASPPAAVPTYPSAPSSVAVPGSAELARRLTAKAPGQLAVVAVAGVVYEGATYNQTGSITFWKYGSAGWTKIGASTYPYYPELAAQQQTTVTGTVLGDMDDATFIVHGQFTMDGAENAAVYTTGRAGWGALEPQRDHTLASSGHGPSVTGDRGLYNDADYHDGLLHTATCSSTLPLYQCSGSKRVLDVWAWNAPADFLFIRNDGLSR